MLKNNSNNSILFVIFVFGLILRILFAFYLEDRIYWDDGFEYVGLATRLIEGKGYVDENSNATAFRAPGYPFILAAIYSLFGHRFLAVRIIQCLLDACTILIVFLIARIIFNQYAAKISAFIFAIYPLFVYTANTFFPTTIFIFLVSIIIFLIISIGEKPTLFKLICLGLVFALATLTVPTILVFVPFAIGWILFSNRRDILKSARTTILVVLTMMLALSPWLIRNFKVFNKPFVIETNGGYNFWMGNNQWATASSGNMIQAPEYLREKLNQANSDTEKEFIYYQDALQFIKSHPGRFVSLTFQKALNLWRLFPTPGTGYKTKAFLSKIAGAISYGPVLVLAVLGLILSWREKKKYCILLILLFFSFTMMYAFFIAKVRFRLPLDSFLIVLAGDGALRVVRGK